MEFFKIREIRNKVSPIFKMYNFDQYFLTLSFIVAYGLEAAAGDSSNLDPPVICPLTSWQTQIVLRQSLLTRFNNAMAQDLVQTGPATLGYFPFCTCVNGVSITSELSASMVFPFVFAENVRSSSRITSSIGPGMVADWLPILTRPAKSDVPTLGNFTYNNSRIPDPVAPVYTTLGGELDIDLIDLSFGSPAKQYINANGNYLSGLINTWNVFLFVSWVII